MTLRLNPYLNFRGQAREAITFYQSVFGGDLQVNTFAELGGEVAEDEQDLVMHSQLEAEDLWLMAGDVTRSMDLQVGSNISISLSGDDDERLSRYFDELSAGGQVLEPLAQAPWGDKYGMLIDRFGIHWLVNIAGSAG